MDRPKLVVTISTELGQQELFRILIPADNAALFMEWTGQKFREIIDTQITKPVAYSTSTINKDGPTSGS
jgi:hypothetical protein